MDEYFYRYRPIRAVLDGFNELENQEIYFSAADELNDPMEGFKDLFWWGDAIVWRNLLRHYILCVLQAFAYCALAEDQFDRNVMRNIVFWIPQNLPQAPIREIYERVSAAFLAEPAVATFLSVMTARTTPVRRHELTGYLRALHGFALHIVLREYRERGVLIYQSPTSTEVRTETLRKHAISMMGAVARIALAKEPPEKVAETLFTLNEAMTQQVMLVTEYNVPERGKQLPLIFLTSRLPAAYVGALEKLVHRDWYVACFAKTAENHSMWSTYADGHRGVCLMFRPTGKRGDLATLAVEQVTSASGGRGGEIIYDKSEVEHQLAPVRYTGEYPAIDFFRSLGSVSGMHVNQFWYRGEDGSFSECRNAVYSDHDAWRSAYWRTFGESTLYKTPEWAHEQELRVVLHSMFDLETKESRRLRYRFRDLAGIVFGARTDVEDKLKIMRIFEAKCRKEMRHDFRFLEIRYLPTESRFRVFPLDLLKFKGLMGEGAPPDAPGEGDGLKDCGGASRSSA
jgi:hypothetical protein